MPARPVPKPFLSQKYILTYKQLPGLEVCGYRYYTKPMLFFFTQKILEDKYHVLYQKAKKAVDARDKNRLWICVTANSMKANKVVRTRATRRLRTAILESLSEHGYSRDGKALVEGQRNLVGSLQLHAFAPVVMAKFQELKSQMGLVIQDMVRMSRSKSTLRRS